VMPGHHERRQTLSQGLEKAALRVDLRRAIAASRRLDDAQASPAPPLLTLARLKSMQAVQNLRIGS